jgi:hypothetical protein
LRKHLDSSGDGCSVRDLRGFGQNSPRFPLPIRPESTECLTRSGPKFEERQRIHTRRAANGNCRGKRRNGNKGGECYREARRIARANLVQKRPNHPAGGNSAHDA